MEKLGTIELSSEIFEKAGIGLWAFELDEGDEPRMYVDSTMLRLIGLDRQVSPEETYHAWYDRIDPDHYGEVADAVEKMTGGIHAEVQYPWHHPNGETWVVRCGGVRNPAYTKGVRIEGTHRNVTDILHVEKKSLSDFLVALADNFRQVCFLDPYTGAFSTYAGNDTGDGSRADFYQDVAAKGPAFLHPNDRPLANAMYSRENLIQVLESGKTVEFVVRRLEEDGGCTYLKNRLVPFGDADGTKKLIIGLQDVTAEKAAEKALEEKNAYLEYFTKSFQSAYIVDLENESFEILHMSHEFRHMFKANGGRGDMEAFIAGHIHPDDRELIRRMSDSACIRQLLQTRSEVTFTVREVYGDVEKTMRVLIIRGADRSRAAVGFMDISEEIEKEKENSRRLEAANSAKSAFLFNMSHDIRTPMNAIIGFNNMARNHLDDRDKVADCLDKVESSSKHLLALINDVLDMARIESGRTACEYQPVRVTSAAEELLNMVQETSMKDLTLERDFSGVVHDWVVADKLHVNRIIMNIISNAVKYTGDGGTVRYTIRETPTGQQDRYSYEFIVADTGIGMSEEFLQHLFEEFSRESSSTLSGVEGTGLGMAITKKLVELLGGTIAVQSRQGAGTTVTVRLEMDAVDQAALQEAARAETDYTILKGKKILLVEDNDLNREIAVDILKEYGADPDEAEDGDVAVEKMRSARPGTYDLILMDVQMPRMNGYEATRAIRSLPDRDAAQTPIIAMTANAFAEDVRNALAAGMNGHISKPIDVARLLDTLFKALN